MDVLDTVEQDIFRGLNDPVCMCQEECPFIYCIITFHIQFGIAFRKTLVLCQQQCLFEVELFFKYFCQDEIGPPACGKPS